MKNKILLPKVKENISKSSQKIKKNANDEKSNARELDQFFTKKEIGLSLYKITKDFLLKENFNPDIWLEPSAGSGTFFNLFPDNKLGFDIQKKISHIIEKDFLTVALDTKKTYVALGNPPFGKNSSLAISFFNHCAKYCNVIAFILPKTFKKQSVIDKLDKNFHLSFEHELGKNSFTFNDLDKDVPCVFQIWTKKSSLRKNVAKILKHEDLIFTNKENASFAFQRVGVNAGKIKDKILFPDISPQSHFFINSKIHGITTILNSINWNEIKYNTAGNPSISKQELIQKYTQIKARLLFNEGNLLILTIPNSLLFIEVLCVDENKVIKTSIKKQEINFVDLILSINFKNISYIFKEKSDYFKFKNSILALSHASS